MASGPASPELDPEDLGRREFTKTRKGWDPVEVRAHLLTMAGEIKRLQTAEFELETKVASLQAELDVDSEFDEARMTRVLGEETARVLDAARAASVEIRTRAEEHATRLEDEARERAEAIVRDADELRLAASVEADELVAQARQRADALLEDAQRAASELRAAADTDAAATRERAERVLADKTAEAEAEAERIRQAAQATRREADAYAERTRGEADDHASTVRGDADRYVDELRHDAEEAAARLREDAEQAASQRLDTARAEAEATVETAREHGRQMVQEAKEARERMLRDLAERRRTARQQLEALRAGRERLLEAFSAARAAFDDATDELTDALPSARAAADAAAREVDDDLDAAVAEIEAEIGPVEELDLGPVLGEAEAAEAEARDDQAGAVDDQAGAVETEPRPDAALAGATSGAGEAAATDSQPPARPADAASPDGGHLRLVSDRTNAMAAAAGTAPTAAGSVDEGAADEDDLVEGEGATGGEPRGAAAGVEAIFARLRAQQGHDEIDDEDEDDELDDLEDDEDLLEVDLHDEEDDDEGEDAGAVVIDLPTGEVAIVEPDVDEEVAEQASWLDRRDDVVAELERNTGRRLKRVLSDQENVLLDRIQKAKKGKLTPAVLGDADADADAVWAAVAGELADAVGSGGGFLDDDQHGVGVDPDTVVAELRPIVDEWVAVPLRDRLERTLGELEDRSEGPDRVRAAFREWKNEKVADVAGDLVTLAFNRGIVASSKAGAAHVWVVDHGGVPSPDCDDNHLAGAVEVGDEFPTGHLAPPAQAGCRCLLVTAPG